MRPIAGNAVPQSGRLTGPQPVASRCSKASRRLSGELDGAEIGHSSVDFQPQTGQYHLCNACVDGEKSLVNIEPGAAAARHFCVDVLANFELPAPWRRRGLQVIGSRWSRLFTLCAQFGTPASGLRIDGCRTCAATGNGANDYKRFGSKWRRQASHLHQLGHKIWGSLY